MTDPADPSTDTVAVLADRLLSEFGLLVSLDTVTACVLSAQRDLDRLALNHIPPNLLDRLARARVLEALTPPNDPPPTASP